MKKLTWVSTSTYLQVYSSRAQAVIHAPEGAYLLNHDKTSNTCASIPFAKIVNGKAVKVYS